MRHDAVVIPDSFESVRAAWLWCQAECEILGLNVKVSYYLPVRQQIFIYAKALGISDKDVLDRVGR